MRSAFLIAFLLICHSCFAGLNQWSDVGPHEIVSGDFTFHPTNPRLMFLSWDGVFRSQDAGATWKQLDLFPGAYTVQFPYVIKIHPANPERLLAVSYPAFESLDRGTTWTQIAEGRGPGVQFPGIRDIEFDPENPAIVWAVHSRQAVLRSNDGGRTWEQRNKGLPITDYCCGYELEINPVNPKILYVLLYLPRNPPAIYKTTNSGESWISVSQGLPSSNLYSLEIDPQNPQTLYTSGEDGIFKTVNGGKLWSKLQCNCPSQSIAIDPKRSGIIYASLSTAPRILKSNDAGKSWKKLPLNVAEPSARFGKIGINPLNTDWIYSVGNGFVYRSKNGGNSWQRFSRGLTPISVFKLVTHPQVPGLIYAVNGSLYRSANSGNSWGIVRPPEFSIFSVSDLQIHPQNPNFVVAAGHFARTEDEEFRAFLFSLDRGITWQIRSPYFNSSIVAMDPQHQQNIYADGAGENFYGMIRSTDMGRTWKVINQGLPRRSIRYIRINPVDTSRIFVLPGWRLYRSTNYGEKWEKLPNKPGESLLEIEFDPQNPRTLYGLFTHPKLGQEFRKSTDEGQTWNTLSKIPKGVVNFEQNVIRFDRSNPEIIYLGGYGGLLVSIDSGKSWNFFDVNGLTGAYSMWTRDLVVKPWGRPDFFRANYRGVLHYNRFSASGAPVIRGTSSPYAAPSETIKIVGDNFGDSAGSVSIGDTPVPSIVSWSSTQIEIRLPDQARTDSVTVVVGNTRSNPQLLVISRPDVFPDSGSSTGGNFVAIQEPRDFAYWAVVHAFFGSVLAHDFRYVAPGVVVVKAPVGSGTVPIRIESNGGPAGDFGNYSYD